MNALFLAAALAATAPDPTLTPGEWRTDLTREQICATHWGHDARHVSAAMKRAVFAAYGIACLDASGELVSRIDGFPDEVSLSAPKPLASEASTRPVPPNSDIFWDELMASGTMSPFGLSGQYAGATQYVYPVGYWLKMSWINASWVPAQMINLGAFGHWTDQQFVGEDMSAMSLATIERLSVSAGLHDGVSPVPTTADWVA